MPDFTPEQEQQIVGDLTALDWTRELRPRSAQVISERLGCSIKEADLIVQRLQAQKMIDAVSESGGRPAAGRTLDSYGWKWIRM